MAHTDEVAKGKIVLEGLGRGVVGSASTGLEAICSFLRIGVSVSGVDSAFHEQVLAAAHD